MTLGNSLRRWIPELFLCTGVLLSTLLTIALIANSAVPRTLSRGLAAEFEELRYEVLVERSVRRDCGTADKNFVIQLFRLGTLLSGARISEPDEKHLWEAERLFLMLRSIAADRQILPGECEQFLATSSSTLPLNIR